ncbi:MAG: metallophosphoesterase [Planctomycetota bacterium]
MSGVNLQDAAAVSGLFGRATAALRDSPYRDGSRVRLPARGRLLVTGDLHDNHEHLRKIVHLAGLEASPDHHVVLHEIVHSEILVNGLDLSHRMLARVAELVVDHPGQVHVLLGNHELAQMTGQRVSKGAGDNVKLFSEGLAFVFGDDGQMVADATVRPRRALPGAGRTGLRQPDGVGVPHGVGARVRPAGARHAVRALGG